MKQSSSKLGRMFLGMIPFLLTRHDNGQTVEPTKYTGGYGGSGNFNHTPYFPGKQIRTRHFNKKRNGKRLRRAHKK